MKVYNLFWHAIILLGADLKTCFGLISRSIWLWSFPFQDKVFNAGRGKKLTWIVLLEEKYQKINVKILNSNPHYGKITYILLENCSLSLRAQSTCSALKCLLWLISNQIIDSESWSSQEGFPVGAAPGGAAVNYFIHRFSPLVQSSGSKPKLTSFWSQTVSSINHVKGLEGKCLFGEAANNS